MTEIYKIGRIYMLCSDQTDDIYIGSTKQSLNKRLSGHKKDYKRYLAGKTNYLTSFELCKYDDCNIYEIERFNNISKKDLKIIEGNYILNCECVNKFVAGRTQKESKKQYYEQNKDKKLQYQKVFYEQNKDKRMEYQKQHYEQNKEKIKQYYINNKEKIKQYYINNKEKINQKQNCECGGKYTTTHKSIHEKSIRHKKYYIQ